jgi:hypothetical protein
MLTEKIVGIETTFQIPSAYSFAAQFRDEKGTGNK